MGQSQCTCIELRHDHEAGKCLRFSAAYRGSVCLECHDWLVRRPAWLVGSLEGKVK